MSDIDTLHKAEKGYCFTLFLGQIYEVIGDSQSIIFHVEYDNSSAKITN